MRYFAKRARKKQGISLLKVCPTCLGDLVPLSSDSLRCMQCNETVQPATARPNTLPLPKLATLPGDFFSEQEPSLPYNGSLIG
jgi:hypothetical protein